MKAVVKVSWSSDPVLVAATEKGFERIPLKEGRKLDYEIGNKRRCTGYHADRGEHVPCPEFRSIDSGDQCSRCRSKDIYTGWRTGNSSPGLEAEYSVYLAQAGTKVKVGVARTSRLNERWLEQGADYAAEVQSGLTGEEALEKEKALSSKGVEERIRKEHKIKTLEPRLQQVMDEHELSGEIQNIHADRGFTARTLDRDGRIPEIKHVKGQMVSDGKRAVAFTSGKILKSPEQTGLGEF